MLLIGLLLQCAPNRFAALYGSSVAPKGRLVDPVASKEPVNDPNRFAALCGSSVAPKEWVNDQN